MDYSSLPQYPPHDERPPSQSERHREARVLDWEGLTILAVLTALLMAVSVIVFVAVLGRAVGGLAG